jgi:hypothetical protein
MTVGGIILVFSLRWIKLMGQKQCISSSLMLVMRLVWQLFWMWFIIMLQEIIRWLNSIGMVIRLQRIIHTSIYLQLQAEDMGLGSCWVQVRERFTASGMPSGEYVHEVLDIPLQLQVLSDDLFLCQFFFCKLPHAAACFYQFTETFHNDFMWSTLISDFGKNHSYIFISTRFSQFQRKRNQRRVLLCFPPKRRTNSR